MQRIQKDKQYISEKEAKQKEAEEGTAMDVETSEVFTDENYFDALKRASRKVSEPDPEKTETSE